MNSRQQIIFWVSTLILLTLLFSTSVNGWIISFFFSSFLLPVAVGTSMVFNQYLVPKYLLAGKRWLFVLYFIYLLIISVYLELLVLTLGFVILADYQIANLGKIASDVYLMTVIIYLIVFIDGTILIIQKWKQSQQVIQQLQEASKREQLIYINLIVNRKLVPVLLDEILFIESLSDYIKVHLSDRILITKERISALELQLPSNFIRIHRSFLVNKKAINSFNREVVQIGSHELTIGRKFKQGVLDFLSN